MTWKLLKTPALETYSFAFSMPLLGVACNLILYKERFFSDPAVWYISYPLICFMGFFVWLGVVSYTSWVERRFPSLAHSRQRLAAKAFVYFLVMVPSVLFILLFYHQFSILGYQYEQGDVWRGLALGLAVNLVFETLYEADFVLGKMQESSQEREQLIALGMHSDFELLRDQVNPHFLFNCFNTLSSLISVDKERAQRFLAELSTVYRYLLRSNRQHLATVDEELQFIQSYFQLLQTRYGAAVQLSAHVDDRYKRYQLPPLSLQLLVENVVKHNALSKAQPLTIDIFTTTQQQLVVSNNCQPKAVKAPSNKVGLQNIQSKYALLGQQGFAVLNMPPHFTVLLPLLAPTTRTFLDQTT